MTPGYVSRSLIARRLGDMIRQPWNAIILLGVLSSAVAVGIVGGLGALLAFAICVALTVFLARRAADPADRVFLVGLVLLAMCARAVFGSALHAWLVASSGDPIGWMFQDDRGYVLIASELARSWSGLPTTGEYELFKDPSIATEYVLLSAAVLWAFGQNVLAVKLVNATLGVVLGVIVYRTMRNLRVPSALLGALVVLFTPSLALWSVLTLKDTFALLLTVIAVWGASEAWRSRTMWPHAATFVALLLLRDVRSYAFLILAIAWPLSFLIAERGVRRIRLAASSLLASALLVFTSATLGVFDETILGGVAFTRSAMAQGARSAYVEPPPVATVLPGEHLVVEVPGVTPHPSVSPRIHEIPPGCVLVVDGQPTPAPAPVSFGSPRPHCVVMPGDIIVVREGLTSARTTSLPAAGPTAVGQSTSVPHATVFAFAGQQNIVGVRRASDEETSGPGRITRDFVENARHFPLGFTFLLSAPFPLFATGRLEQLLIPEMLLLYLIEAFAILGLWRAVRERRLQLAFAVLSLGAITVVLSLIEGNVGTLVRHRAMVIPFAVILAGLGLAWAVKRLPSAIRDPIARLLT